MMLGLFIANTFAFVSAIGFNLPHPDKKLTLGENKPLVRDDTVMVEAGLITSFTNDFFTTYNKDIIDTFLEKMDELKREGASGQYCDEYDFGKIATMHMCI